MFILLLIGSFVDNRYWYIGREIRHVNGEIHQWIIEQLDRYEYIDTISFINSIRVYQWQHADISEWSPQRSEPRKSVRDHWTSSFICWTFVLLCVWLNVFGSCSGNIDLIPDNLWLKWFCLLKLMSGSNVPGIDQNEQAVFVRDSIATVAAESLWTTDLPQIV